MIDKTRAPRDDETAEEARHVAEDAVEAAQHGDMKEARFLAHEAEALDPEAAREVLDAVPVPVKGAKP